MYTLHCTKKLLDRVNLPTASPAPAPTTVLGDWYATALFWKPQVALIVNERTLLPLLMPLAPASTVVKRFPPELAQLLAMHGADHAFIASEVAAMGEVSVAKTASRSVVGTMNEFAFLAEGYREYTETSDLLVLSMRLAGTPCSAIKHNSPSELIKEVLGASTLRTQCLASTSAVGAIPGSTMPGGPGRAVKATGSGGWGGRKADFLRPP